jgi:hypothetical protein
MGEEGNDEPALEYYHEAEESVLHYDNCYCCDYDFREMSTAFRDNAVDEGEHRAFRKARSNTKKYLCCDNHFHT